MQIDAALVARRRRRNTILRIFSLLTSIVGVFFLFWILFELAFRGFSALSVDLFTKDQPVADGNGGILHAILGSMMIVGIGMVFAVPVGVLAGTYLAEYGRGTRLAATVRFINDVLLSAPSILIGLFVYSFAVAPFGGFSGWAGAIALAIIATPVILRTSEDMLLLVPQQLREAASALGASSFVVTRSIVWRAARAGIVTGCLLALARIFGETAPLITTALNNLFFSTDMSSPMANLPVTILQTAGTPYPDLQALAWAASFVVAVIILGLSLLARYLLSSKTGAR